MKPNQIQSFADLEQYLTHFTTWDGDQVYHFAGAVVLLGALLNNLQEYALPVDLEVIGSYLTDEQKAFLAKIADLAMRPEEE